MSKDSPDFSIQRDAIKAAIEVSKRRAAELKEALEALEDARMILQELEGVVGFSRADREKMRRIDAVLAQRIPAQEEDLKHLLRACVASLAGYRRERNDGQPCDAEKAARAYLGCTP